MEASVNIYRLPTIFGYMNETNQEITAHKLGIIKWK